MVSQESPVMGFTDFFRDNESKLRHALIASLGAEAGREASSEAMAYGWEHWDRVSLMENPVGYLYRVGRDRGRRHFIRSTPLYIDVDTFRLPDVEPALPKALAKLSERQRSVVMLIHCFEWTLSEVAEILGLAKTSVQNHLERGMATLRREIGGVS